jgi:hypothetical protein
VLGAAAGIAGRAQRSEHLGADSNITCAVIAGGREQALVVRAHGRHAPRSEELLTLGVAAAACHWFSPASGERLADAG